MGVLANPTGNRSPDEKVISTIRIHPKPAFYGDENEDCINNCGLSTNPAGDCKWEDWPASRHNLGCTMSFADGHVEYWKWRGPWKFNFTGYGVAASVQERDLARVQATVGK